MKITIPAESLDLELFATSDVLEFEPKTDQEGTVKTAANGQALLKVPGLQVIKKDENGRPAGMEQNIFLGLTSAPESGAIYFGQRYRPTGDITLTHFVNGSGRLAVSIQIEGLQEL